MSVERIPVYIYENDQKAAADVARRIAEVIRARNAEGRNAVLGLATGNTPIHVYRELIRMHEEEGLDFTNVITFNLDEYWPIDPDSLQSYHRWMDENFFNHINIPRENIRIPSGTVPEDKVDDFCREYEKEIRDAGGIDVQILGIGRSGHIGFNEPGSAKTSRTRRVRLDRITRKDAAGDFFGEENVPEMAITMGVGTILSARTVYLMAFGEHKAPIVARAVEEEPSTQVAASFLQEHADAAFFVDLSAAANLTRMETPWVLGRCKWDEILKRQAVIWLARQLKKPILKLTDEDYAESGLVELIRACGGAYNCNLDVFRHLMNTITGWPGGKKGPRRVLVLSPHPDDDVICMAGTLSRLVEQGHDVHVAHMVSGYLAVFDHDAVRYADFVRDFNKVFGLSPEQSAKIEQHIDQFLLHKAPMAMDSPEVQNIKALIRRSEALAADRYCGLSEDHVHFLDLPFYKSGVVQKLPLTDEDIAIVRELYEALKPEMLFAAGDMSDPHGTHRLCLHAAMTALDEYVKRGNPKPDVWFYRGAWQEWTVEQIEMAVPLSPGELKRKRFAIFRHESQKDKAMFPGPYDAREFWQRAEERNIGTAQTYDLLGLPEYHALEAFARSTVSHSRHAAQQCVGTTEPALAS